MVCRGAKQVVGYNPSAAAGASELKRVRVQREGARGCIAGHLRVLRLTAAAVPTSDVATSTPLLPMPTTTTRLPSKPCGFLYLRKREAHDSGGSERGREAHAMLCSTRPLNEARPGKGGVSGMTWWPLAIMTWS